MFEPVSEATPLASRVFHRNAHGRILRLPKDLIQSGGDVPNTGVLTEGQVRARMHHQEGQSKVGRELDLLAEGLEGLVAFGGRWRGQIDQVSGMAKDAIQSGCRAF